ncbi:MAG: nitroreductase family protein [Firmicutes bacterium]|nr:nitroreductase family protein [Bacillota bacterium]
MDLLLTRRSIRKFTEQKLTDEQIEKLLRAAMSAPSGRNIRPWHFVVLRDRKIMDGISAFAPNTAPLKGAPAAVVVCGDLNKDVGLWVQDCSCATQNLLLAAHALGLGGVWLNIYPNAERIAKMREFLGMPEHIVPLCVVAVGYPAEEKPQVDRYNPELVHYDRW